MSQYIHRYINPTDPVAGGRFAVYISQKKIPLFMRSVGGTNRKVGVRLKHLQSFLEPVSAFEEPDYRLEQVGYSPSI